MGACESGIYKGKRCPTFLAEFVSHTRPWPPALLPGGDSGSEDKPFGIESDIIINAQALVS